MRKWAAVIAAVITFAAIGTQFARAQSMDFASQLINQAIFAATPASSSVPIASTQTTIASSTASKIVTLQALVATLEVELTALIVDFRQELTRDFH